MILPTDEEIILTSEGYGGYVDGAIWMRDTYCKSLAEENERLQKACSETAKLFNLEVTENQKLKSALDVAMEELKKNEHIINNDWVYGASKRYPMKEALAEIESILK